MMAKMLSGVFLLLLVSLSNAAGRENKANLKAVCSNNVMHIRINFDHPFKGVVFTPDNYFNKNCSYAASPTSTMLQVDLKLPYETCGTTFYKNGNKKFATNTLIVEHHRMLDTVYDYVQNVSCELQTIVGSSSGSELKPPFWFPKFRSWITFQLGSDLFSEEVVEATSIGHELFLTYHIIDNGIHKDMKVMNCIGHDDLIVDEKTKIYQLSDPFGCPSSTDALSSFSVIRNWGRVSNLLAYAIVKNVSMVTRGRFYITCGAQLCKETCETKCDEINRQTDPLYFSDMATKGMVNRSPNSKIPSSLFMFERGGRHRRADNRSEENFSNGTESFSEYLESKMEKLNELVGLSSNSSEKTEANSFGVAEDWVTYAPVEFLRLSLSKRRVKLEAPDLSSKMRVVFIPSDHEIVFRTYERPVLTNITNSFKGNDTSSSVAFIEVNATEQLKTDKPCNYNKMCGFNSPILSSDRYVLNCILRTIVAIFALLCFSGACYSLFFVRREPNNSRNTFMTYSYE